MKFDAVRGASARTLRRVLQRVCTACFQEFETRDPQQERCKRPECRRAFQREQSQAFRARHGQPQRRDSLVAPELQRACEALEARLTAHNRKAWPQIIAVFDVKPVAGYRDLARLTRECVAAKRKLSSEVR